MRRYPREIGGGRVRTLSARQWALGLSVVLGVGFPLTVAWLTGALRIPHNDAWAYSRIARTFGESGHVQLVGWNRMFLLGQVVVLGPLARSIVWQHLFVAVTGVLALGATYALLRSRVGERRAIFATAVLAAWPGFGLLATSFMTDVPSYAATVASLALGQAAIRRRSLRLLGCALVVGIWGMTIREQGAAALVAVSLAALAAPEWRRRVLSLVVPAAAACVALETWRRGLPNGDPPSYHVAGLHYVAGLGVHAYFTLAAPLLPLTAAARPSTWRRSSRVVAVVVGAAGAGIALGGRTPLLLGNYLTPYVAYREASQGAPRVVPSPVWGLVLAAAVVSGALLAGALLENWRRVGLLLGGFSILTLGFVAVELAVRQPFFDRDLLPLFPVCAIVSLWRGSARVRAASYLSLAGAAALGALLLVATLSYDVARWRFAERSGVAAANVDAGLEWVGSHAALPVAHSLGADGGGFDALFPRSPNCDVVTGAGAPHEGRVLRTYRFSWPIGGARELLLVRRCRR